MSRSGPGRLRIFDKAPERAETEGSFGHPSHQKLSSLNLALSLMIQGTYEMIWASCLTSFAGAALSLGHGWLPGKAATEEAGDQGRPQGLLAQRPGQLRASPGAERRPHHP